MKAGIKSYKSAQERLNRYVRDHEMRPSKVRNMVLEQVLALPQPFTAEQLIETCAADHISVGTVYNALNLFLDAHILHAYKRQEGQRATEYELIAAASNKIQMICKKC
jgi:Fe2+ or Zn2+ uptake regulation protein